MLHKTIENGFALFHNDDNKSLAMQFLLSNHDMLFVDKFISSEKIPKRYIIQFDFMYLYSDLKNVIRKVERCFNTSLLQ